MQVDNAIDPKVVAPLNVEFVALSVPMLGYVQELLYTPAFKLLVDALPMISAALKFNVAL